MACSVELLVDAASTARVQRLRRAPAAAGIAAPLAHAPHISLRVRESVRPAGAVEAVATFARTPPPLAVMLSHLDIVMAEQYVIHFGVTPTRRLLERHEKFYRSWEHYLPDRWFPHCTVAVRLEAVALVDVQAEKLVERFKLNDGV